MSKSVKHLKSSASKPKRVQRSARPNKSSGKSKSTFDPVADLAERKRIGETLDLAAFDAMCESNTTAIAYWETPDDNGD